MYIYIYLWVRDMHGLNQQHSFSSLVFSVRYRATSPRGLHAVLKLGGKPSSTIVPTIHTYSGLSLLFSCLWLL